MQIKSFSPRQRRVLAACFITYFCAYIGRLNMSATLDSIMNEMNVTSAQGGSLQTVFAVVYACGQFAFGALVDHVNPRKLMATGLIGSALANLAFSFSHSFGLLLGLWAMNGLFQSMLWTPIVRLMAENFAGEKRKKASFTMSFTLALGHLAAWALSGAMCSTLGWRKAYMLPAAILVVACATFMLLLPSGTGEGKETKTQKDGAIEKMPLKSLASTGLVFVLLLCMLNGFVRDGVITWAPTILGAEKGMFTLIIPCINLVGILFGSIAVRRAGASVRLVVAAMMALCVVPALILFGVPAAPVFLLAILLSLMSAILYGTNPMLTTLIPMAYHKVGRVGLVAGLVDSFIYLGSALAGVATGALRDATGSWQGVFLLWAGSALIGAAAAWISVKGEKKLV